MTTVSSSSCCWITGSRTSTVDTTIAVDTAVAVAAATVTDNRRIGRVGLVIEDSLEERLLMRV